MEAEGQNPEEILQKAVEIAKPAEQMAYLERACGDNERLRAEIESLLRAHQEAGTFLDSPALDLAIPLAHSGPIEGSGTVIGRYKLLERIGEGGMATVYTAEQEHPVRRKVALKIIKLGMDTKSVIARFEAERQALAMMDHPGIAKVFDAGITDVGRPYFVMELIRGIAITQYCDRNKLTTEDRLSLFIQVCHAVQHAHQKGIIHRDIKPSNVMVTMCDGKPAPKVIDFGIAKATNQKLTEKTLFTRYTHIVGTPAYMSPEQAELGEVDVDTRSDIYSLGVLLYELLTDTTPFGEEQLRQAGYLEMQRIIREEEPTKPSTKLSTLGATLSEVAQHRRATPDALQKLIRGDLDWIVMKALEKARRRRYDTASAVAADIQRHLGHEPVLAHPPRTVYRLQKFLRRNRVQVVVVLALAVLVGSLVMTLSTWNRHRLQLVEAQEIRDRGTLSAAHEARGRGDLHAALATVESILDKPHVGPEAHLLHAQLVRDLRGPTTAVRELEALLGEPDEIAGQAHFLLAKLYYDNDPDALGRTEEYRRKWEYHRREAARLLPESADACLLRAITAGTVPKTFALLDRAVQLDSRHYDSLRERAFLNFVCRDLIAVVKDASQMIGIRSDSSLGYSLRAMAQCELKRYEDALKDHNEAIALSPDEPELYNQRRRTYLRIEEYEDALKDAQTCVDLSPSEMAYHFDAFCDLTALGHYDDARTVYDEIVASGIGEWRLGVLAAKHVFNSLRAGRVWHSVEGPPGGPRFWGMRAAAEHYRQWAAKAQRVAGKGFRSDWSPDGNELAYGHGFPGFAGVAIWNRQTGKTRLLTIPGRDPVWSPDGQTIAYVRNRKVLPVQGLAGADRGRPVDEASNEIWLIRASGTEDPEFLVRGSWPQWSRHSGRIFFCPPGSVGQLHSVSPNGTELEPLMLCPSDCPVVSPDDRYVAYSKENYVQVRDMTSGALVAQWLAPIEVRNIGLGWSPDGQALSLGIGGAHIVSQGLWMYNLNQGTAVQVLGGACGCTSWSPPEQGQIAIQRSSYGESYYEIWTAATAGLLPGKPLAAHAQDAIDFYTRLIQDDHEDSTIYVSRAAFHIYRNDAERAFVDLERYESLVKDPKKTGGAYFWLGWYLCHVPQKRVAPEIAVKLLKRAYELDSAPKNRWKVGALGIAHYRAGHWRDAIDWIGRALEMSRDGEINYYAFIMAMAHWQAGDNNRAQTWYEWTVAWMSRCVAEGRAPLQPAWCFYMEAAELMGLEAKFVDRKVSPAGTPVLPITAEKATRRFIFGEPVNLGPTVNSEALDWASSVSADGLELYFHSDRLGGYGGGNIWVTRRETTDSEWWSTPTNLGPAVNRSGAGTPSISADGLTLFFSSGRPGGSGNLDLWVTTRETKEDEWDTPVNLGPTVNSPSEDSNPCISSDGLELYFTSDRADWRIWVTRRATADEPWGTPTTLDSTFNRGSAALQPSISADGLTLLFSSWRSGGYGKADLWSTTRATTDASWPDPVNLGPTVNSSELEGEPALSPDGSTLYFTSDRPGGLGSWDLWQVSVHPAADDLGRDNNANAAVKSDGGQRRREVMSQDNEPHR